MVGKAGRLKRKVNALSTYTAVVGLFWRRVKIRVRMFEFWSGRQKCHVNFLIKKFTWYFDDKIQTICLTFWPPLRIIPPQQWYSSQLHWHAVRHHWSQPSCTPVLDIIDTSGIAKIIIALGCKSISSDTGETARVGNNNNSTNEISLLAGYFYVELTMKLLSVNMYMCTFQTYFKSQHLLFDGDNLTQYSGTKRLH